MTSNNQETANAAFLEELKECATLLAEKLHGDNYEEAATLIHAMVETRDQHVFQSVGRLTRALHDSIVNFNVDADLSKEPPAINASDINDASNRLNYVIELTQQAAEKTMDMVDEAAPIAMNLGYEAGQLQTEWSRLKRREMTPSEFRELYTRMDTFLEQMVVGANQVGANLQSIVLEQGFQDLTGQVLKRVIGLINDVERDLVSLVRMAGQVEEVTGLANDFERDQKNLDLIQRRKTEAEGPQVNKARTDVVSGQDEVDDLLSSLGF